MSWNSTSVSSIEDLVNTVGKHRIDERRNSIYSSYQDFLRRLSLRDTVEVTLSQVALRQAVVDYFYDVVRLKDFHDIKLVNEDKIIAYTASWLLRRHPIQVLTPENPELIFINEKFVALYIMAYLMTGIDDNKLDDEVLNSVTDTIFYHLKYRTTDAKSLELAITMFRSALHITKKTDLNPNNSN